jgi:hypothetical protein
VLPDHIRDELPSYLRDGSEVTLVSAEQVIDVPVQHRYAFNLAQDQQYEDYLHYPNLNRFEESFHSADKCVGGLCLELSDGDYLVVYADYDLAAINQGVGKHTYRLYLANFDNSNYGLLGKIESEQLLDQIIHTKSHPTFDQDDTLLSVNHSILFHYRSKSTVDYIGLLEDKADDDYSGSLDRYSLHRHQVAANEGKFLTANIINLGIDDNQNPKLILARHDNQSLHLDKYHVDINATDHSVNFDKYASEIVSLGTYLSLPLATPIFLIPADEETQTSVGLSDNSGHNIELNLSTDLLSGKEFTQRTSNGEYCTNYFIAPEEEQSQIRRYNTTECRLLRDNHSSIHNQNQLHGHPIVQRAYEPHHYYNNGDIEYNLSDKKYTIVEYSEQQQEKRQILIPIMYETNKGDRSYYYESIVKQNDQLSVVRLNASRISNLDKSISSWQNFRHYDARVSAELQNFYDETSKLKLGGNPVLNLTASPERNKRNAKIAQHIITQILPDIDEDQLLYILQHGFQLFTLSSDKDKNESRYLTRALEAMSPHGKIVPIDVSYQLNNEHKMIKIYVQVPASANTPEFNQTLEVSDNMIITINENKKAIYTPSAVFFISKHGRDYDVQFINDYIESSLIDITADSELYVETAISFILSKIQTSDYYIKMLGDYVLQAQSDTCYEDISSSDLSTFSTFKKAITGLIKFVIPIAYADDDPPQSCQIGLDLLRKRLKILYESTLNGSIELGNFMFIDLALSKAYRKIWNIQLDQQFTENDRRHFAQNWSNELIMALESNPSHFAGIVAAAGRLWWFPAVINDSDLGSIEERIELNNKLTIPSHVLDKYNNALPSKNTNNFNRDRVNAIVVINTNYEIFVNELQMTDDVLIKILLISSVNDINILAKQWHEVYVLAEILNGWDNLISILRNGQSLSYLLDYFNQIIDESGYSGYVTYSLAYFDLNAEQIATIASAPDSAATIMAILTHGHQLIGLGVGLPIIVNIASTLNGASLLNDENAQEFLRGFIKGFNLTPPDSIADIIPDGMILSKQLLHRIRESIRYLSPRERTKEIEDAVFNRLIKIEPQSVKTGSIDHLLYIYSVIEVFGMNDVRRNYVLGNRQITLYNIALQDSLKKFLLNIRNLREHLNNHDIWMNVLQAILNDWNLPLNQSSPDRFLLIVTAIYDSSLPQIENYPLDAQYSSILDRLITSTDMWNGMETTLNRLPSLDFMPEIIGKAIPARLDEDNYEDMTVRQILLMYWLSILTTSIEQEDNSEHQLQVQTIINYHLHQLHNNGDIDLTHSNISLSVSFNINGDIVLRYDYGALTNQQMTILPLSRIQKQAIGNASDSKVVNLNQEYRLTFDHNRVRVVVSGWRWVDIRTMLTEGMEEHMEDYYMFRVISRGDSNQNAIVERTFNQIRDGNHTIRFNFPPELFSRVDRDLSLPLSLEELIEVIEYNQADMQI